MRSPVRLGIAAVVLFVGAAVFPATARAQAPFGPPDTIISVALSEQAARRLGVQAGDLLELAAQPTGPWQRARVAQVYRPVRYPTEVGRTGIDLRLHLPDLQTLRGRGDQVESIVVRLRDPANGAAVAARLNAAGLGFRAYTSADLAAQNSNTFEVIRRFHRAIGLVTILASSVFLIAIMTLKGEEMRKVVGVMCLIGISSRTIAATILVIATSVALLGSLLGIGLGYVLSLAINVYYRRLFDTDLVFSRITLPLLGSAIALSLALGIAAGALMAWRRLSRQALESAGR
jgi:putative ABC transport system permease protein